MKSPKKLEMPPTYSDFENVYIFIIRIKQKYLVTSQHDIAGEEFQKLIPKNLEKTTSRKRAKDAKIYRVSSHLQKWSIFWISASEAIMNGHPAKSRCKLDGLRHNRITRDDSPSLRYLTVTTKT